MTITMAKTSSADQKTKGHALNNLTILNSSSKTKPYVSPSIRLGFIGAKTTGTEMGKLIEKEKKERKEKKEQQLDRHPRGSCFWPAYINVAVGFVQEISL
ncbi:hypothetical protein CEXT_684041 [Caerostris extrusa]|uniref:Uncharacterized protein n=1 Tax=Caerostris extrusa TaxID=172846 RepID=A0AAV4VKS9_CAEEX|nr:hypothetical protein CEXT_684041 [Caerostris extrusa]